MAKLFEEHVFGIPMELPRTYGNSVHDYIEDPTKWMIMCGTDALSQELDRAILEYDMIEDETVRKNPTLQTYIYTFDFYLDDILKDLYSEETKNVTIDAYWSTLPEENTTRCKYFSYTDVLGVKKRFLIIHKRVQIFGCNYTATGLQKIFALK